MTIQGGGAVTIATSNSYTGGTSLANGLLNLANAAALGTGPSALSGGSLDNTSGSALTLAANNPQNWNGSFTFLGSNPLGLGTGAVTMNASPTVIVTASTLTVGGPISGTGALPENGSGTLLLTASNSYAGGTTISGGVLQLGTGQSGQDGSINGTPAVSAGSGASLVYNLYGNQTAAYPISGGGSLVMAGSRRSRLRRPTPTRAARPSAAAPCKSATAVPPAAWAVGTFSTTQTSSIPITRPPPQPCPIPDTAARGT